MDVQPRQSFYIFHSRDPAGGDEFVIRGGTYLTEPIEIGSLHHAFLVHVRAKKAGAVLLQLANDLNRSAVDGLAPAFHNDAAMLAVKCDCEPFGPDGVSQFR